MTENTKSKPENGKIKNALLIVCATIAIVIGCLFLWKAADIVLLSFAAVLLAIIVNAAAQAIRKKTNLRYSLVVILVILTLLVLLTLIFWIASPLISQQVSLLIEQLPQNYNKVKEQLSGVIDLSAITKEKIASEFIVNHEKILGQATAIFSFTVGAVTSIVLFGLIAIYLAFSPVKYMYGFLQLFPVKSQKGVYDFLLRAGHTLRWWTLGKLISMAIIGILTFVGLLILKVPLAFVLALIATLLTFIPYIGPIISSIPAILIGLSVSPLLGFYVVLLYLLVHAIDSYIVSPYIDLQTVALPPALTIVAQLIFTLLFGFIGLALATPLLVLFIVTVQEIYRTRRA